MPKGKTSILLLLILLLLPSLVVAQMPRPKKRVFTLSQAQKYMSSATFNRVVTVDANGSGDYTTLGAALAYVATQTRGGFTRYLVLVYPGDGTSLSSVTGFNFTETSISVPDYTVVQGVASGRATANNYSGIPVVALTGTSGTLVSVGFQSAVVNLDLKVASITLSGNTKVLSCNSGTAGAFCTFDNVSVKALSVTEGSYTLDLLTAEPGTSFSGWDVSTYRSGSGANTRNVVNNSSGGLTLYGGRHVSNSAQTKQIENASTGAIALYGVRLDPVGAVVSLTRSSTGAITVGNGMVYTSSSGVITDPAIRAGSVIFNQGPQDLSGSGAPEGVVSAPVGSTFRRTDGGAGTAFCVKESGSGNTGWVCK